MDEEGIGRGRGEGGLGGENGGRLWQGCKIDEFFKKRVYHGSEIWQQVASLWQEQEAESLCF